MHFYIFLQYVFQRYIKNTKVYSNKLMHNITTSIVILNHIIKFKLNVCMLNGWSNCEIIFHN